MPEESLIDKKVLRQMYESGAASALGSPLFHPFLVVSTIMTVNKTE